MVREAQALDDADFAEEPPLGYRSEKHRERYVPIMATLLVVTFLAQTVLPYAISFAAMPLFMRTAKSAGMQQFGKMTAWQGELWYPTLDGGSQGGCKLLALDVEGKPLDKPAIVVNTQPDWLVADGDRLWAVSKNEVAEVYADGSHPAVMRPTRYLQNASTPFLYEGKLAVIDSADQATWSIFVFENGEWIKRVDLDFPSGAAANTPPVDAEVPADALNPEQVPSADQQVQAQRRAAQPFLTSTSTTIDRIQVVPIGTDFHVVFSRGGKLHHCTTLPLAAEEDAPEAAPKWNTIDALTLNLTTYPMMPAANGNPWSLTVVDGAPALLTEVPGQKNSPELWRYLQGRWQMAAQGATAGAYNTELTAFTLPDGSRTLAVVSSFGGLSQEILELHPSRIQKIKGLNGPMMMTAVSTPHWNLQLLIYAVTYGPTILLVLIANWLMLTHRERQYHKGQRAVEYASLLRRCVAAFIDLAIWWGPVAAGWYWWFAAGGESNFWDWYRTNIQDMERLLRSLVPGLVATLCWLVFVGVVMWLTVAWGGFTIGKYLCGVRVVRTSLELPGLFRALLRTIIWPVETVIFQGIIAFSLITLTPHQQRLADLVVRCVVVKARSLRRAQLD